MERKFRHHPVDIVPGDGGLPDHVTAGACLVCGGRLLLEWRPRESRVYPGLWDLPGGHVEPGESPEAALIREMEEELGIRLVRFVLGMVTDDREPDSGRFYRHFLYIVREWEHDIASREGRELLWLKPARALRHPALNPVAGFMLTTLLERGWLTD